MVKNSSKKKYTNSKRTKIAKKDISLDVLDYILLFSIKKLLSLELSI